MKDRVGDMLRRLKYGRFECRYTYKYLTKHRGIYEPSKRHEKTYSASSNHIYIEGEEDDIWDEILLSLGNSDRKKVKLTNKKITEISDFGYSLANKDGSINIRKSGR